MEKKEPVIWKKHSVWISVIISSVLVIITGILAFYTYGLYSSSQKSIKQQGDYYEATTRPFLNVVLETIVVDNLKYYPPTKYIELLIDSLHYTTFKDTLSQIGIYGADIEYSLMNYGSLPAKEIQITSIFLPY